MSATLPRLHERHLQAVIALAATLVTSFSAEACSCFTAEKPDEEYSAIFEGRAVSIEEIASSGGHRHHVRACFDVVEARQGTIPPRVCVGTGVGGGDCGFQFVAGRSYLVFARGGEALPAEDGLYTSICDRTIEVRHSLLLNPLWPVIGGAAAVGTILLAALRIRSRARTR